MTTPAVPGAQMSETPQAWGDDVALRGPDAPKNTGQIRYLIEYLLTVHKRFGNTAVTCDLQWGATALWTRDEQKERIDQLERELLAEKAARVEAERERDEAQAVIAQHDLCHDLHGKVDAVAFAEGCAAEQRRLYGCAPHADRASSEDARRMDWLERCNVRVSRPRRYGEDIPVFNALLDLEDEVTDLRLKVDVLSAAPPQAHCAGDSEKQISGNVLDALSRGIDQITATPKGKS